MKFKISFLFLFILTVLSTSCNQTSTDATPAATLEIINLQITPELEHWLPLVSKCAQTIDNIGIYTEIRTQESLDIEQTDLVLKLGQRDESDPYVAVMGYEEMVIIGGSEVPVDTLSIESLQAIFTGGISNWGDLPEVAAQEIEIDQPIQTLSFPENHILAALFSISYLNAEPIQSTSILYSTTEGLTERLQENPYSIAYLLRSHKLESQDALDISNIDPAFTQQYVLGITDAEPEGKLKQLLLCLQDS